MYSKQDEFSEETAPQQIDVYQETAAYQANDTSDDVNVYPKKDDEKVCINNSSVSNSDNVTNIYIV